MNGGETLGWISLVVSLLLGLLVFVTNRRANKTSEKQVSLEEQDDIARRRKEELDRLYPQLAQFEATQKALKATIDELERKVTQLERADESKQLVIDEQAEQLERMNQRLADTRSGFRRFMAAVEEAWPDDGQHSMPTLTDEERALLEDPIPYRIHHSRGAKT